MTRLSRDELSDLAQRLAAFEITTDELAAHPGLDDADRSQVLTLGLYIVQSRAIAERRAKLGGGQRRALRLLRTFLTPAQREQLGRNRAFVVALPSGRAYRLHPNTGWVARVERHGSRWVACATYCLHEPDLEVIPEMPGAVTVPAIPPADRTIGHLLLLLADEARFLALANYTARRHGGWDGDWRRRLNRARAERAA